MSAQNPTVLARFRSIASQVVEYLSASAGAVSAPAVAPAVPVLFMLATTTATSATLATAPLAAAIVGR